MAFERGVGRDAGVRIAVLHAGGDPRSSELWSGTPRGLIDGLEAYGCAVVALRAPRAGRVTRIAAHGTAAATGGAGRFRGIVADRGAIARHARTRGFARSLVGAGRLDGVVVMGSDALDVGALVTAQPAPVMTYDDSTLAQMWRHPSSDPRLMRFPSRRVEEWIATQRRSALAASGVAVCSEWAVDSFVHDYGVPRERVHVVGIGHRPRILRESPTAAADPAFLFVGVDWERKNGAAVVAAFRAVRAAHPTATLHVVGDHPQFAEAGVVGHGMLRRDDPGQQRLLDELYASSTAFVLPSRFEPFGIVYLEAASAGLPIVATREGGAAAVLGGGAIAVDPGDRGQIERAMQTLCDPVEARRRGGSARTAAGESTWEHVAERLVDAMRVAAERDAGVSRSSAGRG